MEEPIKHIVIQGGGSIGFNYIGMIKCLYEQKIINPLNIESIFATSIGTLIATFICLKIEWNIIVDYIINRPWKNVFKISSKHIMNIYQDKGLFGQNTIDIVLKPLLKSVDLKSSINLKDFYEYSKINIHFFTFDLNKHETIDINHVSYPDLELSKAIYMSSSCPILFSPCIQDTNCFIDGGVLCNYPLHECVKIYENTKHIFGLRYVLKNNTTVQINSDSNVIDYIFALLNIKIIPSEKQNPIPVIEHEVISECNESPMSLNILIELVLHEEKRSKLIKDGEIDVMNWIKKKDKIN